MRFFYLLAFLFLFSVRSNAQLNHFIYIETENKQLFDIKVNERTFHSSLMGYMVIPKLNDGTYRLNLAFPKSEWPARQFDVTVNNRDAGFILRYLDKKGWGLINLQTMDTILPVFAESVNKPVAENKTDAFSNVLADVVNTPSIKQQVNEEEVIAHDASDSLQSKIIEAGKVDSVVTAVINEQVTEKANPVAASIDSVKPKTVAEVKEPIPVIDSDTRQVTVKEVPVVVLTESIKQQAGVEVKDSILQTLAKPSVSKSFSALDKTGRSAVYIIEAEATKDTVTLFIPYKPLTLGDDSAVVNLPGGTKTGEDFVTRDTVSTSLSVKELNKDTAVIKPLVINKEVITEVAGKADKANDSTALNVSNEKGYTVTLINTNCKSNATDDDFLKLRKKMAAADTDEKMIGVAKKGYKSTCFSTEQVKHLSQLFLTDEGKYNFYDAFYGHVTDPQNFKDLQVQLTDEYYITRFKAMLR